MVLYVSPEIPIGVSGPCSVPFLGVKRPARPGLGSNRSCQCSPFLPPRQYNTAKRQWVSRRTTGFSINLTRVNNRKLATRSLCSRSQEDTPSERLVARHATNCESGPSTRITPWLNSSGLMQKKNANEPWRAALASSSAHMVLRDLSIAIYAGFVRLISAPTSRAWST